MADEQFLQEGLRIHNEYRRKHGVPDMRLNREVRYEIITGKENFASCFVWVWNLVAPIEGGT